MTLTTAISVAIFLGLLILVYTHYQKLAYYFIRIPSDHNATAQTSNSPTQSIQEDSNEQKETNTSEQLFSGPIQ